MAGYIRADTANNINDGNVVDASVLDSEFDAIVGAFNASTGHTHDGTAAEGAPITKVGPAQDFTFTSEAILPKTDNTYDIGSASFKIKDLYIDGAIVGATISSVVGPFAAETLEATESGTLGSPAILIGDSVGFYEVAPNALSISLAGVDKLVVTYTDILAPSGVSFAGSGANLQSLNASEITTGTLDIGRFPDPTLVDAVTWVRDTIIKKHDKIPNEIGNFAMLKNQSTGGEVVAGSRYNGSDLRFSGTDNLSRGSVPGSWVALGACAEGASTLFIRAE